MPLAPGNKTLLDFAIVGQPKSGTTALADFLAQHPEISFSVPKETSFFATDLHRESDAFHGRPLYCHYRTPGDLRRLFKHADEGDLLGEGSVSSLCSKKAAANLHAHNPDVKIIMVFRDPAEMLHSLHTQYVNETVEDITDFAGALAAEPDRRAGRRVPPRVIAPSLLYYRERVKYTEHVERFRAYFPWEQILVLFAEEFRNDNSGHFRRTARFLGVDEGFGPDFRSVHPSKAPRSMALNRLLNTPALKQMVHRVLGPRGYTRVRSRAAGLMMREQSRDPVPESVLEDLRAQCRPEVERFGEYVGRDLLGLWGYRD